MKITRNIFGISCFVMIGIFLIICETAFSDIDATTSTSENKIESDSNTDNSSEHIILHQLEKARRLGDLPEVYRLSAKLDRLHGVSSAADSSNNGDLHMEFRMDSIQEIEELTMQFNTDVAINASEEDVFRPSMTITRKGYIFVAMCDRVSSNSFIRLYRSTDKGRNWTSHGAWRANGGSLNPSVISVEESSTGKTYIFIACEGNSDSDGTDRLVIVIRVNAHNYAEHVTSVIKSGIMMNGENQHLFPEIATDAHLYPLAPNLYVTYSTWGYPLSGVDFYPVFFSKSIGVGGGWSQPTDITGSSESTSWQARPDISFGKSGLFVVYEKPEFYQTTFYTHVWVRKSSTFGSSWERPVSFPGGRTREYHPQVAVANDSTAVVVAFTKDYLLGGTARYTRLRYSLDGGVTWSWPITELSGSPVAAQGVEIKVSNRSPGRFLAAYASGSVGGTLVFRCASSTNPGIWSQEVKVNSGYSYSQYLYPKPALAFDPTYNSDVGAAFAWVDSRETGGLDIYFNREEYRFPWTLFLPALQNTSNER